MWWEPTHSPYPSVGLVRSTFPHSEIKGHELGAKAQGPRMKLLYSWAGAWMEEEKCATLKKISPFCWNKWNASSFNVHFLANSQISEMLPVALTNVSWAPHLLPWKPCPSRCSLCSQLCSLATTCYKMSLGLTPPPRQGFCVAPAVLEFALQTRLTSNSEICLSLPPKC